MRKGFLIVLAVALVAVLAAPAMAGTEISGLYRTKAWMSNFRTNGAAPVLAKDAPTNNFVEQRLRLKFASGEENVKVVAFFEIDFSAWGDAAGSTPVGTATVPSGTTTYYAGGAERNSGGALGGDRINLETKNVYLWFKLPDTSLDLTVGLQGQTDAYAGLIFGGADMAGIFLNGKMEPVGYSVGWAKLYENASGKYDDLDFYKAAVTFAPNKQVNLGFNLYYVMDETQNDNVTKLPYGNNVGYPATQGVGSVGRLLTGEVNSKKYWTAGVNAAFNAGPATLSGFAFYQFGKIDFDGANSDSNINGYALDLRGDMNVGPGKGFLELLYVSGSDMSGDDYKGILTFSDFDASPGGNSAYGRTDMSILLVNLDDINCAQALVGARATAPGGSTSPSLGGRGMTHIAAGYSMKLSEKMTTKFGLGWLTANNLYKSSGVEEDRKGKGLGTEINANVNYNIMKGLDFGLYGAYAFIGDYFDNKAGTANPDDPYSVNMRLNYAF